MENWGIQYMKVMMVSQPVLVCVPLWWYAAVSMSGVFWVQFWLGDGRFSLMCTGLLQFSIITIFIIIIIGVYVRSEW